MGGGRGVEPIGAGAQRRTGTDKFFGAKCPRGAARKPHLRPARRGKNLSWDSFRRVGPAHRSYAKSKGEMVTETARETVACIGSSDPGRCGFPPSAVQCRQRETTSTTANGRGRGAPSQEVLVIKDPETGKRYARSVGLGDHPVS